MQMFLVHQVWNILIFIITLICKCPSKIWTYGNVWMLAVVFLMGETVLCCWGFLVEPSPRELSPSTLWQACWDQHGSLGVTHTLGYERCPDFFSFLVDHGSESSAQVSVWERKLDSNWRLLESLDTCRPRCPRDWVQRFLFKTSYVQI